MNTIAISELRSNLPTFINQVSEQLQRVIVTVAGKPKAVILSLEEVEALEETAEILAVPDSLKKIRKGIAQAKKGQGLSLAKLR